MKGQKMSDKQWYIKTFAGVQIQMMLLVTSALTAYGYAWMGHTRINDTFIVTMLRSFIVFVDVGMFLAVGYMIDFKRGVVIGYVYKVLAFLQAKESSTVSEVDFMIGTAGKAFGLVLYYKLTLFLIVYTASYIVGIDHEQAINKKQEQQEQQKRLIKEQSQKLFSQHQRQQLYNQEKPCRQSSQQLSQIQKTIRRIRLSLRHHKQDEFYKKLQIFFFIFYNSVCVLTLFPTQEYVLDFGRVIQLSEKVDFLTHVGNLKALNLEVVWYVNFQTVWSVVMFWLVILIGEFRVKRSHPQLMKDYLLGVPAKFLLIQGISLVLLLVVLGFTPISSTSESLSSIRLISLVNYQILAVACMIHTLLPLFISFLLLRLYLGQTYYLNRLVSRRFSFHQNDQDSNSNLDGIFYQCVIQDDITRARHFIIDPKDLLSRHKLKRYTDEEKLKHYVDQAIILEVQSLFQDHLVLDLYNKLSRYLAVGIFYIALGVFLVSLNVNDTYFATEDEFFVHVPAILLWLGLFLVFKYESTLNVFYSKPIAYMVQSMTTLLTDLKAYNMIKLLHFYAIIFSIWLYRIYSEIFLPTHISLQQKIKLSIYDYYSASNTTHTSVMSQLLAGWSQYFTTHSSSCDYDTLELLVDSFMVALMIGQVVAQKHFMVKGSKGDPILLVLKLLTPFYVFFVFVVNMECMEWGRVMFCCCLCVGVAFMHVNEKQLQRGIVRNDEGPVKEQDRNPMH